MELKMNIRSNTPVNFDAIRKPFKPCSQTFKDKIQKGLVEDYLWKAGVQDVP